VPETLLDRLNSNDGHRRHQDPGLASFLSDPKTGKNTVVKGLDTVPTDDQPTIREVNTVHLAWDVMVGIGTALFLLSVWYGLCWIFRREMPKSKLFLWIASGAGVASVLALEAGWTVAEVGRPPWIVYNHMKVEGAATAHTGVWITFVLVVLLYAALGTTAIIVLRRMSRRFRREARPDDDESDVPYGPRSLGPIDDRERVG
jgi:cytochrome d ubiquinol oxidase subunit I